MVVNPIFRQILATLAASSSTFGWGCNIGLPATLISKLRDTEFGLSITDEDASWIGSCLAIGGALGALLTGKCCRNILVKNNTVHKSCKESAKVVV